MRHGDVASYLQPTSWYKLILVQAAKQKEQETAVRANHVEKPFKPYAAYLDQLKEAPSHPTVALTGSPVFTHKSQLCHRLPSKRSKRQQPRVRR